MTTPRDLELIRLTRHIYSGNDEPADDATAELILAALAEKFPAAPMRRPEPIRRAP